MASHPEFSKETTSEQVADAFAQQIRRRSVIITGVSPNSLGEAMARAIASKGPSLLVLKQSRGSIQAARSRLSLDLSSQKSVRQAAIELENMTKAVDVLINNAGVMAVPERTLSEDGEEMQFATNYLGHFLFTNLIMDKLLVSANQSPQSGARIVDITSVGHVLTPLRFHNYGFKGSLIPYEEQPNMAIASRMGIPELDPQGGHSNTANMLFTTELAENLRNKGVYSFTSAPGVVDTELQRHMPKGFRNPQMFYKTPRTFLVAAFDPNLKDRSGAFLDDCQIATAAEHAADKDAAARLWALGENLVGEKFNFNQTL